MRQPFLPLFVAAALVIAVYAALMQLLPLRIDKGQNQHDTNLLRAESYLAKPDDDIVLVGSSLTYRLPPSVLGPHIANLAMAGGAPATGLVLVERSGAHPKLVLVEVNLLLQAPDMATVQSLLRFPERQLRESLLAFRTGYDPVNVVERGIQALLHSSETDLVPLPDAIRRLIAVQQATMSHAPDAATLDRNLAQTAVLVSALEARGIRVGFFEMPMDSSLMDSHLEKDLRQAVLRRFPSVHHCWMTLSVPGGAHTLDGIHLTSGDAAQVAKEVASQSAACLNLL